MPEIVVLTTSMPPMRGMSEKQARARLSSDWKKRERTIQAARKAEGKPFLGARRICAQSPLDYPRGGEPRRNMNPRVASVCKWTRIEKIQRMVAFIVEYSAALESYCRGDHTAIFPSGTYEMHVLFGAPCRDPVPT